MASSAAQLRVLIRRRLYEWCLAEAPQRLDGGGPVQVLYAADRTLENECILFAPLTGERQDPPHIAGGSHRLHRDDVFTLDVLCLVRENTIAAEDQYTADLQAATLAEVVELAVSSCPGLGSGGGREDVEDGVIWSMVWLDSGPAPADLTESGLGVFASTCVVKVEVHTRLT